FNESIEIDESILFGASYGNIILELKDDNKEVLESLSGYNYKILGNTVKEKSIFIENEEIDIDFIYNKYCEVLEPIFPTKVETIKEKIETISFITDTKGYKSGISLASPK
ncbi:hypothetical protein, partial [Paraclostridium sordellii]